jgi:hypothetical protein
MGVRQRKHPLGFPAGVAFAFRQTLAGIKPDANGCLNWPGPFHGKYGRVFSAAAHRIAWSVGNGNKPNPFGMEVDHLCRNTHCVNFEHLEVVDKSENVRRMNDARRRSKNYVYYYD